MGVEQDIFAFFLLFVFAPTDLAHLNDLLLEDSEGFVPVRQGSNGLTERAERLRDGHREAAALLDSDCDCLLGLLVDGAYDFL